MNVSVICACKNRIKPLTISLQSWLLFDEIKEVIIVDWSSDESITHLTKLDPRIKIITVSNKKYFNQPQPLNLAASIASGDSILKFDADHIINPYWNFFKSYPIDENTFASGCSDYETPEYIDESGRAMVSWGTMTGEQIVDYCNQYSEYYKSLYGMLHVTKENFVKCGGFNENLGEYYGFEDTEFQKRLELLGLHHRKLNYDHNLFHIPHPDSNRIENFKGSEDDIAKQIENNLSQHYSGDILKYQTEYGIAQYHVNKNKNVFGNPESYYVESKTKWNLQKIDEQNYIAIEIKEMNNLENFPPVYYVTLEESKDRQEKIEHEFAQYGIIPNSIKSKRFSESDDVITGKYLYQLTGPTRGCIVSHLKAIKTWYESSQSDYAFFCEDDLSLKTVDCWNFRWQDFVEHLPSDWECVQLMTIRADFDSICFRDRQWNDWSETAYIMTREYAKKIIDNYCVGETFHLELKDSDIMPIGENILFTNIGRVYTFPMFVENVDIPTTDVNDTEVEDGQKPNHTFASEFVYYWWNTDGRTKTIEELMGIPKIKKSFVILEEEPETIQLKHNIVDCFTYFNEKEILELRINLLKDHVDKFVIVDANYTHSGDQKEYSAKKVIQELNLPEEIIEVIEADLSLEKIGPATDYEMIHDQNPEHASRERVQRDLIAKCLETNKFDENTVFIVSDCDEIINPEHISMMANLARTNRDKIFKCDLVHLEGRPDLRVYHKGTDIPREWRYSLFVCLKEHMEKVNLTYVRSDTLNPYPIVWPYTEARVENDVYIPGERMTDLGWHFTWMGSNVNRFYKSQNICHFNTNLNNLLFSNYYQEKEKWKEFFENYELNENEMCPSGDVNYIIKKYPVENLPQIIFDLPRVKEFLFNQSSKKEVIKNELEQLLYDFSLDTENPEHNFNLGLWYENEGHTAPALSYFLRCAERAADTDKNLAYEALIRGSYCYEKQGTRDGSARSMLWQAQMFLPERPEAYYLLARFAERRDWWQDCYSTSDLCLRFCDFNQPDLRTNVEYPGKHGLMFLKATSGWWWGKGDESRSLLKQILTDYDLNEDDRKKVLDNLTKVKGEL